jgi:hypothetical protein
VADFDSPWKEILDQYFEQFLPFFVPAAHAEIDWGRGYEMLDKEFEKIIPESEQGHRVVDKLVKVWLKDGEEWWLLVHVEVQTSPERDFPRRMHVYNYRIFERYNREVVSLAVLADEDPDWRPTHYSYGRWGARTVTEFLTFKLLDYAPHEHALEVHPNAFALVVLAQLKTRETRQSAVDRQAWKRRLIRTLYERGMAKEDVRQLLRFIDWIMKLPKPLQRLVQEEIGQYTEETRMPYVTTMERIALEKGLIKGIEALLDVKFGDEGLKLLPDVADLLLDHETLEAVLDAIRKAPTLEGLRPQLDTLVTQGLLDAIEKDLQIVFEADGLKVLPEIRDIQDHEVLRRIINAIPTAPTPDALRRIWAP